MLDALLAELAPLTHTQRFARLVALGRAAAADEHAAAQLDALATGDAWQRRLATWACYGRADAQRLLARIDDPSRGVRKAALGAAIATLDDAQFGAVLERVRGRKHLTYVLAQLSNRGRTGPIDAWLEPKLAGSDADVRTVIDLLPLASDAVVNRHAARFAELASYETWTRLARRKPTTARELLHTSLAGKSQLDPRTQQIAICTLTTLADHHPDVALALVPELLARGADPQSYAWALALQVLARRRPAATFDAMRDAQLARGPIPAPGAFQRVHFDRRTEQLGVERIAWLMAHAWHALPDQRRGRRWMLRLSTDDQAAVARAWLEHGRGSWGAFMLTFVAADGPLAKLREAAFRRWRHANQDKHGDISPAVLAWLPADLRHAEAHRQRARDRVRAQPNLYMSFCSLLDWSGAQEALASYLGHPEGEVRAIAQRSLLAALRHDRDALPHALEQIHARRFEQDPVRLAMLAALNALPDGVWAPRGQVAATTFAGVEAILDDAWDAADLSTTTASEAERLAVRLFRHDAAWGTRMLTRALKVRGNLQSPGLLIGLPKPALAQLIPALESLARTWLERERWGSLAWLCHNLRRDLGRAPALVAMLHDIAREAPFPGHTGVALQVLATWHRPGFATIADELVQTDPSTVVFAPVARWISTRRQDLLDRVLITPMTGRWATGRSGWVIPFDAGFATWTADQQRRYAAGLTRVIDDHDQSVPEALSAVRQLAQLSYIDAAALIAYTKDPRQPIRETAVRAVGRWDGPEAVGCLVGCLGDARARWAIYALRRILLEQTPEQALQTLLDAPRNKVTVVKEIIRLIGEFGPLGYEALLQLGQTSLHRDARIALLRALWSHLEREQTWALFEAAARDDDWVVASRLASVATSALSSRADRRYCALLAQLLAHPEQDARVTLLGNVAYARLRDDERSLFGALLGRLGAPAGQERQAALQAVLTRMQLSEAPAVAKAILATRERPQVLAEHVAIIGMVGWNDPRRTHVRDTVRDALLDDPLLSTLVLRLSHRMNEAKLAELLGVFDRKGWLGFDTMQAAIGAIGTVVYPDALEQALRQQSSASLQRLGLAALEAAARSAGGWTAVRREALEVYRRSRSPLIAGPARLLELPPAD